MSPRTWAEIDIAAIKHNLAAIRSYIGSRTDVMVMVKANAYGHGLEIVSRAARDSGISWFGVATVQEGSSVRALVPESRICLFPPFLPGEESEIVLSRLIPLVSTEDQAASLAAECRNQGRILEVHLDVETGMGRTGALPDESGSLAEAIINREELRLTGVSTHFPCADSDIEFTQRQVDALNLVVGQIKSLGIDPIVHAANSGGMVQLPESRFHLVRPGLLVFGIRAAGKMEAESPSVRPVLSLKTRVALIRNLPAGHSISYGRTRILTRPTRVATLPVGYGDGYPRELSGRGSALVRGVRAPILGRICMDVTMIDVTDVPDAATGDEVVLIGEQGAERIRADEIAEQIGTTEHDITTRLASRVARIPIDN